MKKIAVIGAGSWGTALAIMLEQYGHDVTLWARNQKAVEEMKKTRENKRYLPGVLLGEKLQITTDQKEAVEEKEIVISAVPSRAVRETMINFSPFFQQGVIIVNAAKGLEQETVCLPLPCLCVIRSKSCRRSGSVYSYSLCDCLRGRRHC